MSRNGLNYPSGLKVGTTAFLKRKRSEKRNTLFRQIPVIQRLKEDFLVKSGQKRPKGSRKGAIMTPFSML